MDIDPIAIAVFPEWAAERSLPTSAKFPWDPRKQVYYLKVYHQLHCMVRFQGASRNMCDICTANTWFRAQKIMHKAFSDHEKGKGGHNIPARHVYHCLNMLRSDLACYGDDMPMAVSEREFSVGDNQQRQCKDLNRLGKWAKAPERDACYAQIVDWPHIAPEAVIERFGFCKPGSQYYLTMQRYFDIHGHNLVFDNSGLNRTPGV
ncbi:MAG: hypothetical protein Q9159_003531 [Coniocarpon cinnabarinum]